MELSSLSDSSADEGPATMGRPQRPNPRGPAPIRRPELDLSSILDPEQKSQLVQLVNDKMDAMQKQLRDVFETVGEETHDPQEGMKPFGMIWTTIPNPRSAKYAHLYGVEPLQPKSSDGGSPIPQADDCEPIDGDVQPLKARPNGAMAVKGVAEDSDPIEECVAPLEPMLKYCDGGTSDVMAENCSPVVGQERQNPKAPVDFALVIKPGSNPTLRVPKTIEEAATLAGKRDGDMLACMVAELKRDSLAAFGKWRGAVQRRLGDIVVKTATAPNQAPNSGNGKQFKAQGKGKLPPSTVTTNPVVNGGSPLLKLYPSFSTPLSQLPRERRALVLHGFLLLLTGMDNSATFSRALLLHLASSIQVPFNVVALDELRLAKGLSMIVKGIPHEEIASRRAEEAKASRRLRGTVRNTPEIKSQGKPTELSGPLVAAGIGTVFNNFTMGNETAAALLGPRADNTVAVGTLFGLYGSRATGKMMESYIRDVQDFSLPSLRGGVAEIEGKYVDPRDIAAESRRLRMTICVSGLLSDVQDVIRPWQCIGHLTESYGLRWEIEALVKFAEVVLEFLRSAAWRQSKKYFGVRNVIRSLSERHWPISLLMASKILDNHFNVGIVRAEKAGQVLADAIINRVQGERGLTLIGYGLGARVIYCCLMILSEKRIFGSVENAVLMGAPCPSDPRVWVAMKSVVSGRLVNAWSKNDALLGFMYRGCTWQYGVAGLQMIQGFQGIENCDVSDMIHDHVEYQHLTGVILKEIGWEDLVDAEVLKGEEAMRVARGEKLSAQKQDKTSVDKPKPILHDDASRQDDKAVSQITGGLAEVDINKPRSSNGEISEKRPANKRGRRRGAGSKPQGA